MKSFTIHADAEAELREALVLFEDRRAGYGAKLRQEFEYALERIRDNPLLYAVDEKTGMRLCPLHHFPFSLVYQEFDDGIWIAAFAHHRRRPNYWASRKPE